MFAVEACFDLIDFWRALLAIRKSPTFDQPKIICIF